MKTKILEGLKKSYSNLGLSDKVLETQAALLAGFIPAELSDEEKETKVADLVKGAKEQLVAIQSFGDQRANKNKGGKQKTEPEPNDEPDDDENNGGKNKPGNDSETAKLLKQILENQKTYGERLSTLESKGNKKTRDELIAGIAKELGLTDNYLVYAKATLSDEMDETAIRNALGKAKKDFVKMGLRTDDDPAAEATKEEAMRKEEEKWLDSFVAQQEGSK